MTDRRGNTICEKTDRFEFDPPRYTGERDWYEGLRGRTVRIRRVVTEGRFPTVQLASKDPVMAEAVKGTYFPVDYLKLID